MYALFSKKSSASSDVLEYRTQGLLAMKITSDAGFTNLPIVDSSAEDNPITKFLGKNTIYTIVFKIFPSFHYDFDSNTELITEVDNDSGYSDLSGGTYTLADPPLDSNPIRTPHQQIAWLREIFVTPKIDDGFALELFEGLPIDRTTGRRFGGFGLYNDLDLRYSGGSDVLEATMTFQIGDVTNSGIDTLPHFNNLDEYEGLE